MEDMLNDSRFAHIAKDPKFRRIPKQQRKVKIDKRFRSMFTDKKFTVKYTIDKRGRPINQTSTENLKKYYELSDSENESLPEERCEKKKNKARFDKVFTPVPKVDVRTNNDIELNDKCDLINSGRSSVKKREEKDDSTFSSNGELLRIKSKVDVSSSDGDVEKSDDENSSDVSTSDESDVDLEENERQLLVDKKNKSNKITTKVKRKLKDCAIDYARGEGVLLSDSSSSEEESSDQDDEESEIKHDWGELDKEAETTNEISHRLAVCNLDWDRIRAIDLMVLFNSFLPNGGLIRSITIYPSEFGLQRMKEEEMKGPLELVEAKDKVSCSDADSENEEGSKYHMEKLRQYQLNRLKYYYAVADCDSAETANKIYTECDGMEYESTANKIDLRFIPDDMTFDQEPKETCDKLPELSKYLPRQFTNTALQQAKVELTWDETDPERLAIAQKLTSGKIDDVNDNDIQAYLGSGSSDEESDDKINMKQIKDDSGSEENEDPIEKYKSLLKSIEEEEEAQKKRNVELEFTWGLGDKEKTEKLVTERKKKDMKMTPFEEFLEKRKAKKKAKRQERKLLLDKDENDSDPSDSEDSLPSGIDLNDPYFAEERQNMKSKSRKQKVSKKNGRSESPEDQDEQLRTAELELLLMDKSDDANKKHFNMKDIEENQSASKSKKKRLIKKRKDMKKDETEDNFEVNVNDPRFGALFSSHHFNIDPADPHYRKTKGTEILIREKLKRRANEEVETIAQSKERTEDKKMKTELSALVKSVKRNTQNISSRIK